MKTKRVMKKGGGKTMGKVASSKTKKEAEKVKKRMKNI